MSPKSFWKNPKSRLINKEKKLVIVEVGLKARSSIQAGACRHTTLCNTVITNHGVWWHLDFPSIWDRENELAPFPFFFSSQQKEFFLSFYFYSSDFRFASQKFHSHTLQHFSKDLSDVACCTFNSDIISLPHHYLLSGWSIHCLVLSSALCPSPPHREDSLAVTMWN